MQKTYMSDTLKSQFHLWPHYRSEFCSEVVRQKSKYISLFKNYLGNSIMSIVLCLIKPFCAQLMYLCIFFSFKIVSLVYLYHSEYGDGFLKVLIVTL